MIRRVLIALQEFKGTLSALEANRLVERVLQARWPQLQLDVAPLADGGPGTVDALVHALGGERRMTQVADPLGRPVKAGWAILPDRTTAVLEMAAASGLTLLAPHERDVMRAHTGGTGELVRAALDAGCTRILLGVGGSATVDGGLGALVALGARLEDVHGNALEPRPENMLELYRVDLSRVDPRLSTVSVEVLTDVTNPLTGPHGAARTYGPQKSATEAQVSFLERGLSHLAFVSGDAGAQSAGCGAAGGLAFGLRFGVGAQLRSGFQTIATLLELPRRIGSADVVLTGEGQLDAQSTYDKGPYALARLARSLGKPVVAFAGRVMQGGPQFSHDFSEVHQVSPPGLAEHLIAPQAPSLLTRALERWVDSAVSSAGGQGG